MDVKNLKLKFWVNKVNGLQKTKKVKLKLFIFQFNRFENGYCGLYVRLFKYYSINITGLRLKQGKRIYIGNSDFN